MAEVTTLLVALRAISAPRAQFKGSTAALLSSNLFFEFVKGAFCDQLLVEC